MSGKGGGKKRLVKTAARRGAFTSRSPMVKLYPKAFPRSARKSSAFTSEGDVVVVVVVVVGLAELPFARIEQAPFERLKREAQRDTECPHRPIIVPNAPSAVSLLELKL